MWTWGSTTCINTVCKNMIQQQEVAVCREEDSVSNDAESRGEQQWKCDNSRGLQSFIFTYNSEQVQYLYIHVLHNTCVCKIIKTLESHVDLLWSQVNEHWTGNSVPPLNCLLWPHLSPFVLVSCYWRKGFNPLLLAPLRQWATRGNEPEGRRGRKSIKVQPWTAV